MPAESFADRANRYASEVINGERVACKWVRLACERQLADIKRWNKPSAPYRWNPELVERVCNWVECLHHIKGKWNSDTIILEDWQVFVLAVIFGWTRPDGTRRFRRAYIEVARKNAKSTLSAAIALYLLILDEEIGAEVYSAATTRDQAKIVFDAAWRMCQKDAELRERYGVEIPVKSVTVPGTGSFFHALSADAHTLDGLNVHGAVVDELHAHKTREVWDVIDTADGSRRQPLIWAITTAGSNRAGICYEVRGDLIKILDGAAQDETFFGIIFTLDEDDDFTDPSVWEKANPNIGVSVFHEYIAGKVRRAQRNLASTNNILTKHFNVWVNAATAWMDMRKWEACGDSALNIDDFTKDPCWIGLDLASVTDIAAKAYLFERDGHWYYFEKFWLPEETIDNNANSQYQGWVRGGYLEATDGATIDLDLIEDSIRDDCAKFNVQEVAHDPWQAKQMVSHLLAEGIPMVEVGNNVKNFSDPMKQWGGMVVSGKTVNGRFIHEPKFHHTGNPCSTWQVSNVVAKLDAKDNIYPRKEFEGNKIDGPVSVIIGFSRALANPPAEPIDASQLMFA